MLRLSHTQLERGKMGSFVLLAKHHGRDRVLGISGKSQILAKLLNLLRMALVLQLCVDDGLINIKHN